MRGGELAVECWDCQQMANVRGERNGELREKDSGVGKSGEESFRWECKWK